MLKERAWLRANKTWFPKAGGWPGGKGQPQGSAAAQMEAGRGLPRPEARKLLRKAEENTDLPVELEERGRETGKEEGGRRAGPPVDPTREVRAWLTPEGVARSATFRVSSNASSCRSILRSR